MMTPDRGRRVLVRDLDRTASSGQWDEEKAGFDRGETSRWNLQHGGASVLPPSGGRLGTSYMENTRVDISIDHAWAMEDMDITVLRSKPCRVPAIDNLSRCIQEGSTSGPLHR